MPPLAQQDITSAYDYVYNFQHFIDLLNTALAQAWSNLAEVILAGEHAVYWKSTVVPFFDIDNSKMTVVLDVDNDIFVSGSTSPTDLFLNTRLFELLVGLPREYASKAGDLNYRIKIVNRIDANTTTSTSDYLDHVSNTVISGQTTLVQVEQEISSLALLNPVASILFASSMLPALPT